jgi:hypothetical protein
LISGGSPFLPQLVLRAVAVINSEAARYFGVAGSRWG